MNVFDFAMQMEEDGKAFYEKMASQAGNSVMKDVLLGLAKDEEKHYEIFRRFRDGDLT
ncbi:MAG: ferritin, partial [Candidatus Zixiibacteriota bacterium]